MSTPDLHALTPREREILDHVWDGSSNKEIARLLHISHRTVEAHRARIMTKLGTRNIAQMMRAALSKGLVTVATHSADF